MTDFLNNPTAYIFSILLPLTLYLIAFATAVLISNRLRNGKLDDLQIKKQLRLGAGILLVFAAIQLDYWWDDHIWKPFQFAPPLKGWIHLPIALLYILWVGFQYFKLSFNYKPPINKKTQFCHACNGRGYIEKKIIKTYWWAEGGKPAHVRQKCDKCKGKGLFIAD